MKWPTATIGEVSTVVSGATPKTNNALYWDGDIPWVTPKDLSDLQKKHLQDTPRKITSEGLRSCSASMLPPQSVLFSSRAPIGLVAINTIPVATNQGFKSMVPRKEALNSDYLYWWLKTHQAEVAQLGRGATFKEVSKKIVEGIQIPLPPLPEQKRIAAILDKADSLRTKRLETIKQLDKLARAVFIEMFGDPVTNPKGLKKEKLEKVCDRVIDCPHSTPNWSQSGVICLRTSNLGKGEWNWSDTRYVTEEEYQQRVMRSTIEPNDIILSREGTVGVVAIVSKGMRLCMGQRLVQLRVMESLLNPVYLLHLLIHDLAPERLSRLMAGSTSKHLNVRELRQLPLLLPPLHLQQRFASIITSIQNHKTRRQTQLAELDTLFTSLQARAFKGEL